MSSGAVNRGLLSRVNIQAKIIVEIGCGAGALGADLRARAPLTRLIGVEADPTAAAKASRVFDTVVEGDVEDRATLKALDSALSGKKIDQLVIADALVKFHDPRTVLVQLRKRMNTDATAAICLPNGGHWSLIRCQLAGDCPVAGKQQHRHGSAWSFTRISAETMLRRAGFSIETAAPLMDEADKGKPAIDTLRALDSAASALGISSSRARRDMVPRHWLFSLRAGALRKPRRVRAVGIRSAALSLSTVRLVQPLEALGGFMPLDTTISIGDFVLPKPGGRPGILLTYRLHPAADNPVWDRIDALAAEGWLILHDLDDHPAYLKAQRANDFRSLRSAHAVTVTTPALADVVRPMNEEVHLLPNQIFDLPSTRAAILGREQGSLRAVFAAINRDADWGAQCTLLESALKQASPGFELTAIHAPNLTKRLGSSVRTLPFLDYPDYRREMLRADVALVPLVATEFNACKSDLKIVECLAHGTIPITSAEAADQTDVPQSLMMVAERPRDWRRHIRALDVDRDMLASMKAQGLDWVMRNRMWHSHVADLASLHDRLIADLPRLEDARRKRLKAHGLPVAAAL